MSADPYNLRIDRNSDDTRWSWRSEVATDDVDIAVIGGGMGNGRPAPRGPARAQVTARLPQLRALRRDLLGNL